MLGVILISVGAASTASVSVPATRLGTSSRGISANDLKPDICAAINLTAVLVCPPDCSGTNANELILGSPNSDNISGGGGDDCILGGGSLDIIYGDAGTDVCDGGPGFDFFLPLFTPSCETRIQ
jgi:Ca2+-binding RTX toxin-like protein